MLDNAFSGLSGSRWIWFSVITLVFAGATFITLFVMLALREAIDKFVRESELFVFGLSTLGAVGIVAFLVEVVNRGYVLMLPGVFVGIFCIFVFTREFAKTIVLLVGSSGVILVLWLLTLGFDHFVADWHKFLSIAAYGYGSAARVVAALAVLSFCVLVLQLTRRQRKKEVAKRFETMRHVAYRKMEEEKWQLERRLREIEDMQKYFEQHGRW